MIVKGVASKKRQKLMRNLRVRFTFNVYILFPQNRLYEFFSCEATIFVVIILIFFYSLVTSNINNSENLNCKLTVHLRSRLVIECNKFFKFINV